MLGMAMMRALLPVLVLSGLCVLCVLSVLSAGCGKPADADVVLVNGKVYTFAWSEPDLDGAPADDAPHDARDGWRPDAEAVAIRDGKILYVGDSETAAALAGPETTTLDLDGATVVPGLIESHAHAFELGSNLGEVDLTGSADEAEAVARVAERARTTAAGKWIIGHGWDEGAWADRYPTVEALSLAVPDHPVLLNGLHGFAVWGNRRALDLAGISADTPDPAGGDIVRDDEGNPTGVLTNRATKLLRTAVPATSLEDREAAILAGLDTLADAGYVAVHEAGVSGDVLEALLSLDARDALPLRVYVMLSAREPQLMDEWLTKGPRTTSPTGMLVIRAVKAYYDGALGSRGARLLDDYADRPGHRGVAGSDYEFDAGRVEAMMAAGFQVGIHAIGDAGNRAVLDFIDDVLERHPAAADGRHRIEHAQVLHPADIERFARLGVIASMQPPHAMEDKAWAEDRLGAERIRGAYAWRTLRRSGARLAFNSDLPGSDHDVFYGLHSAIARRDRQGMPQQGWYADQRMTAEEALRAYTTWAAYAGFDEDVGGAIAAGRRADLSILDIDPLAVGDADPGALLGGSVLGTIVGGRVVRTPQR